MSVRTIQLGIGAMAVSREPAMITTVLGSCVSVCLFAPQARIGGVIHYALPDLSHAPSTQRDPFHFGVSAIASLVEEVSRLTGELHPRLEAKLVGGASVVSQITSIPEIGVLNLEVAKRELAERKIPILGERSGGKVGYKLHYYTDSGRLRVALLTPKKG